MVLDAKNRKRQLKNRPRYPDGCRGRWCVNGYFMLRGCLCLLLSGDGVVGGEGFFEAVFEVGELVEAVGVLFKAFERERIYHGGIVEREEFHVAELVDSLIYDVDVGVFLSVGSLKLFDYNL